MLAGNTLKEGFFSRPAQELAPDLLGVYLCREKDGYLTSGRIVEVEAYLADDPASHSFRGLTARNRPMFGPPGRAYIYFIYGNHYCFNVVAGQTGSGEAVLVRALEPVAGLSLMMKRRGRKPLTTGPGRLCQAMAIDCSFNHHPLWQPPLWLEEGSLRAGERVAASTRVGISRAKDRKLRFYLDGNAYVS